jgi:hypothetical protein
MAHPTNYGQLEELLVQFGPAVSAEYDPKILGAIFGQTLILADGIASISQAQWDEVTTLSNHLAYKLGAVRYHYDRYNALRMRVGRKFPTTRK